MKKGITIASIFLVALLLLFTLPLVLIFASSFLQLNEYNVNITLVQYQSLITNERLLLRFENSFIIAAGTLLLQLPISLAGGFYLSVGNGRFKKIYLIALIALLLLPFQSYMLPIFRLFRRTELYNTRLILILFEAFSPLGPLVVHAFTCTIPNEHWEAARLDTSSLFRIIYSVILPQLKPMLSLLMLLSFAEAWNLVEPVIILLPDESLQPLSVSLNDLQSVSWAGAVAYCLPVLLLYVLFIHCQKNWLETDWHKQSPSRTANRCRKAEYLCTKVATRSTLK